MIAIPVIRGSIEYRPEHHSALMAVPDTYPRLPLALHAGVPGACVQVDTRVLTPESLLLGPICVCPHLVVLITVGGFITQASADQLFEVGAFSRSVTEAER